MLAAPLLAGGASGLVAVAALAVAGVLRERGGWATALVAIAAFYVVFAIETGDRTTIVAQSGLATGFVVLALVGARTTPWVLVAGLAGHGVLDLVLDLSQANVAPDWWGPFCLGFDSVLGLALAVLLMRGAFVSASPDAPGAVG